jgi:CRP-like cAMP-binding protein
MSSWTFEPTAQRGRPIRRRRIAEQMELLARAPLFEGLPKAHLRRIADASSSAMRGAGDELVTEGQAGSTFFVIIEGTARVTKGGRTVRRFGPGDFFGEMAILTSSPRSASVIAETDLVCLVLSSTSLRKVLKDEPAIALRMLDELADRLADRDRGYTS